MFNDRYGLTEAVLKGQKTQLRRIIKCPKTFKGEWVAGFNVYIRQSDGAILEWPSLYDADEATIDNGYILPKYKIGEVIAVAQPYKDFGAYCLDSRPMTDKRFAKAEYMPHHIRITNIRIEKLQNITDEDCAKSGILSSDKYAMPYGIADTKAPNGVDFCYSTPKDAYAALVNKVMYKEAWKENPWVYVYDFELVD